MKQLGTNGFPEPPEPPPKREFRTGLIGVYETERSKQRTAEWMGGTHVQRTGVKLRIVLPLIGALIVVTLLSQCL